MITNKGCKRLRDLEKKVDGGSAGSSIFKVTIDENNNYSTDKTWREIKDAFDAGKMVVLYGPEYIYDFVTSVSQNVHYYVDTLNGNTFLADNENDPVHRELQ